MFCLEHLCKIVTLMNPCNACADVQPALQYLLPLHAAVAFVSSCVAFKIVALGSGWERETSARAATGQKIPLCWRHL